MALNNRHRLLSGGGVDPSISLSRTSYTPDAAADELTFTVTSNTDWTISSNQSWCTLDVTSGSKGTATVTATISSNTGSQRSAVITAVTKKRGVKATLMVVQKGDWITSTTYSIGSLSVSPVSVAAAGGTCQVSGGAGTIVYTWKSGKANTSGTFTPSKSVARTSGSAGGSASIDSAGKVTVKSLSTNYHDGPTVFTVTYSYSPEAPSTGTLSGPAPKTVTVTQAKNVITAVMMGTVSAGAITSSMQYAAGTESKTFANVTAPSISGVTVTFSSGTSTANHSTYGTLSGPSYSWTTSDSGIMTLTSADADELSVKSVSRGTAYSASSRSATITRTAAYSYSLRTSYNGGSVPVKSASGSCTGTAVQAANHVAVHSVTANAGEITSSVSYSAATQSKIFHNVTSASAGTCTLVFDSGSTTASGVTTYGAWSGPTYSWLTSDPDIVTLTSSNTAGLTVTSVDRGTVTGPARSATVTRTAVMTFTLKPDYQTAGRTATKSASASCTGTAVQEANTVTYGLPSFKGLRYDKIAPAAGGTAAPKWDLMYQTATYTSGQTVTLTETEMRAASDWMFTQNIPSLARPGVWSDPEFNNGFTGRVYDNNKSGKTTVERVSSGYPSGIPNNTGYALKITNTGAGTNPGLGGFYLDCQPASLPASGLKLVEITINAWIPEGYMLNMAGNTPGTGGSFRMDTPGKGAGEWRTYAAHIMFGPGASAVGHWYLTGTAGTESAPVTWYVAGIYINQISDGWRNESTTNPVTRPSGSPALSAAGAITYPTKGTAVSNTVCGDYGGTTFYVVANGKSCFYTLSAYQAENRKTSSNHNPSGYTATISVGSGIGPGTSGTAGTSATVTYSAYHTASDLYSSGSSNNSHTVYDTATVTKTADTHSKYTLSGATSGSSQSNTCTLSLPNMTSNTGTWSCTLTCKNGSNSSASKTAAASATNSLESYTGRTISAARSSASNIAVGGSNAFYATVTSTRRPVYSSGYTGPATDAPFNVYNLMNCTAWSSASTSGTHYTPSSSLANGQNVYAHVDANYNTLNSRTVTMYFRQADNTSTSTSASWTQNPDTSSLSCYTYDIGLTKSLSSYIPAAGVSAPDNKDYYVTASVTRTPKYVFDNGGGTYNGTADHSGTLTLAGSNCSFTNSVGSPIDKITNGGKAYIKASSNPGSTSSCSSSSRTCSISATAPSDTCAAASNSVTWTQAADSKSWRCDEYEIRLEPASTDAIPVAGTPKDDKYKATLSVTRRRYYKWSVGGNITTECSTDNEGTVTISGTNCTCVDPSGTEITSAKNGDVIYITVGNNNYNTSEREVSIDAAVTGCSTYTAGASWTQSADSEYSCYEYSTSVSRSSSTTSATANSDVTITPHCTSTIKYYWNSDHTFSREESTSWQPTYSVTVSGVTGAELRDSFGSKITTLRGKTAGHLYVPDNSGTSSSRTVTISFSDSQSDNCGSSYTSGLTGSTTVTQSGDTVSFVCYKYDGTTLTRNTTNHMDTTGSSGVTGFYATLTVKKTPMYRWDVAGTTYYGTSATDTSTEFTVTGDRCTPSDQHGTKLSTVTGGTRIYVSKVTSNAHNESTKNVNLNVFFTEVCDGEASYIQASWTQSADSTYTCNDHTTTLWSTSTTVACAANSSNSLTLDSTYKVNTKWNSDGTVKDYGSTTYTDSSRSFTVSVSGISGAEIRNSSGTRITSMTPSMTAYLYVPANGGTSSSRTATISVSSSDSENCYSSTAGLTASASVTQDGDTTYTHHYDYTVSLSKGTYANIACDADGYTPGTYATLTARRRPVHYWTVGGTETGDAVWSNVTADITGSNGGWTTATSSTVTPVSTAMGGSKLYLMALPNVNTASSRTVSLTASVTDPTGTGVKSATASWTQDGDEKVEKVVSGNIPRKYSYRYSADPDNIPASGGTRTLTLSASVTKYWYWKYGGDNAGATTENVTTNSDAAYYNLYTSHSTYGAEYTATLTRDGSTSDWTSGYMRHGDKITVTAPKWTGAYTRYGGVRNNGVYGIYTPTDDSDLPDQMWTQDAAGSKPSWSLETTNELLDSNGQGDDPYGVYVSVTDSDSVGWRVMLTAISGDYSDNIHTYTASGSELMQFNPTGAMPDTTNVLTSTGSKSFIVSPGLNTYCDRNFTLTLYDAGGAVISSCVFYQPGPDSMRPYIVDGENGWNAPSGEAVNIFTVKDECSAGWYISTSDSWITSNTASGTGGKSISLSVTANTSSSSRTGYVYVRAGSSSTSTLYQTMTVTQAGASSSAKPSWNAEPQNQTSPGEFTYSVYVTDKDRVGWNVKMSLTSSSVRYGMSTTSAAAAKSGATTGAKTVHKTGSGYVYIYADFSSWTGSSDYFHITLYGPGETSGTAIESGVKMRWTKGGGHRLKVVLEGAIKPPSSSVPSIQLIEYKDGNVNNVLTFQNVGNGMTQNGPDVIFYVDTSAETDVWSSFLNNINGIAGQSMSFQIEDDMNTIWDSEYEFGPCDYQKIGTVVYNLIQTYNSASTTNMKTFTISTRDFS